MDTQTQPETPVFQSSQQPIAPGSQPAIPTIQPKKTNQLLVWGPFFLFLFLFSMFSFMVYKKITTKPITQVTPTPTLAPPTPTSTPHRALSSIATTSAFIRLDEQLSSYTKNLSGFSVVDPNIAPPVLVLPLDYKK